MPRVLAIRRGALGDTLLFLPVLRALRRAHPQAELHFAGVTDYAAVLAAHGACDRALSSEDFALWSLERARERLAGYAVVVADEPQVVLCVAPDIAVATFDPRPEGELPIGRQWAQQLGLAVTWPTDAWLVLSRHDVPHGPLVLAPGSGDRAKCWPQAHWLALAERLAAAGGAIAVLVGPVERERDDPRRWPWRCPVAFPATPDAQALAATLATARAFVGNDSGPSHLAAMLGVPTVALFGAGQPDVYAPQGPCVRVLLAPERVLAALQPAAVLAALGELDVR